MNIPKGVKEICSEKCVKFVKAESFKRQIWDGNTTFAQFFIKLFIKDQLKCFCNKTIRTMIILTNQLRNDLCDFNDAYIVVTGTVTANNPGTDDNVYNRKVSLQNSAPFFNCTLKINSQLIEDAQDLDIVIPMYDLLYYSKNLRKKAGSFRNYFPDMPKSGHGNNTNLRQRIIYPIKDSVSFNYKTKLVGNVGAVVDAANNDVKIDLKDIKIAVPLKNLSNFMFNLDFLLINSEIELILKLTEDCVLTEKATRKELPAGDDPATEPAVNAINRPKDLKFVVTDCKLYVPELLYQNQLYKYLKTGISIDFKWSKYRSQMIN